MRQTSRLSILLALTASAVLAGCASGFTVVAPEPPQTYTSLGQAKGSACGGLGVLATAYYVVPLGLNSRVERAYQDALSSVPGATKLINVTVQEDWFWWVFGTNRCVTVSGEAVK